MNTNQSWGQEEGFNGREATFLRLFLVLRGRRTTPPERVAAQQAIAGGVGGQAAIRLDVRRLQLPWCLPRSVTPDCVGGRCGYDRMMPYLSCTIAISAGSAFAVSAACSSAKYSSSPPGVTINSAVAGPPMDRKT